MEKKKTIKFIRNYSDRIITLIPLTDRGIFLESTSAECRKRLCLKHIYVIISIKNYKMTQPIVNQKDMHCETYGMTIAPRSEIASLVAPLPLSWGTNNPRKTSEASGFAYPSSAKKQPAIVRTRKAIRISSFRTCKIQACNNSHGKSNRVICCSSYDSQLMKSDQFFYHKSIIKQYREVLIPRIAATIEEPMYWVPL